MIGSGSSDNYIPMYSRTGTEPSTKPTRSLSLPDRKDLFDRINTFVSARSGWLTSIPGARTVALDVLPFSTLPEQLTEKGYQLELEGNGTRVIPHAITEAVVAEGSTKPAYRVTHAGIVAVDRYRFSLP
jgi:hypothetical protein